MNEQQVNDLLAELARTRESFDIAIRSVRWNRVNTIIQYSLIVLVFVFGTLGGLNYLSERKSDCKRDNNLRLSISESLDSNAIAIGVALSVVSGAPEDKFQEYIDVYHEQKKPETLNLREC